MPIKVGGKTYNNTEELLKDFSIGSITNFEDEGLRLDGQTPEDWAESVNGPDTSED